MVYEDRLAGGGGKGREGKVRQTFARMGCTLLPSPVFAALFAQEPIHLRRRSRRLGAFRSWAARRSKETDIAGNIQLFALIRAVWESRRAIPVSGRLVSRLRQRKFTPSSADSLSFFLSFLSFFFFSSSFCLPSPSGTIGGNHARMWIIEKPQRGKNFRRLARVPPPFDRVTTFLYFTRKEEELETDWLRR